MYKLDILNFTALFKCYLSITIFITIQYYVKIKNYKALNSFNYNFKVIFNRIYII